MTKYLSLLLLIFGISGHAQESIISDNIFIKIHLYEDKQVIKASAMPEIKRESDWMKYKRRFEYLLINVPEIHLFEKINERLEINTLYPDTTEIKRLYLEKYVHDKRLEKYFEETFAPISNPNLEISKKYTLDELMEVASFFFYCNSVEPDTSIQAYVCVGLNGVKEANWEKDFTVLEAFCYEAIFTAFDDETSQVWDTFVAEKELAGEQFKTNITTLDQYLEDVKLELFKRMKNSDTLKEELVAYYELNSTNLAFRIVK